MALTVVISFLEIRQRKLIVAIHGHIEKHPNDSGPDPALDRLRLELSAVHDKIKRLLAQSRKVEVS